MYYISANCLFNATNALKIIMKWLNPIFIINPSNIDNILLGKWFSVWRGLASNEWSTTIWSRKTNHSKRGVITSVFCFIEISLGYQNPIIQIFTRITYLRKLLNFNYSDAAHYIYICITFNSIRLSDTNFMCIQ